MATAPAPAADDIREILTDTAKALMRVRDLINQRHALARDALDEAAAILEDAALEQQGEKR